jgi:hypothetical protein
VGPWAWRIIATASALLAAEVAQRGLSTAWRLVTGDDPPTIPEDQETSWNEAVAWAVLSGAVIGVARLVATRRAAQFYLRSTGELPEALQRDT